MKAPLPQAIKQLLCVSLLTLMPCISLIAAEGVRTSPDGDAVISIAKAHQFADVLLDSDKFNGSYTVTPKSTDVGQVGKLYLAAKLGEHWLAHNGSQWVAWNGRVGELPAYTTKVLATIEKLTLASDGTLTAGDYSIFAGYQVGAGTLVYNSKPLQFTVASPNEAALIPFTSDAGMEAYLKQGVEAGVIRNPFPGGTVIQPTATAATVATIASTVTDNAGRMSTTYLQEKGADEADTIKADGSNLYLLGTCNSSLCLQAHTMDSSTANTNLLGSVNLTSQWSRIGMYLVERGIFSQKMMVTVAGGVRYPYWPNLFSWGGPKTEIEFLNLSVPKFMNSIEQLSIDGTLVDSRRIGDYLYLVTRFTPNLPGFVFYNYGPQAAANSKALAAATLEDLVPHIADGRQKTTALINSKNCYLPTSAVDANVDPSIITLTVVPLASPANVSSTCFLGSSETLYMTANAFYLVTTNVNYRVTSREKVEYSPNHRTSIHKFALNGGKVEYRGSGTVNGYLGGENHEKSLTLGENKGYLNVATYTEETRRLTVLRDADSSKKMQVASVIGLPVGIAGVSRFLGDRAWLVPYRPTDPLYMLDLSNQEQPKITGGFKINGHLDYLLPVSDTLLLGIGKEAVPDTTRSLLSDDGFWYQGVKLSLFDVSNSAAPREINSIILGKRGTATDISEDHHAVTFLPAVGNEPARLAIPVQIFDTAPQPQGVDPTAPSERYSFTHTALYSFEISKLGIARAGSIISPLRRVSTTNYVSPAVATLLPTTTVFLQSAFYSGGRSLLKDDAVFYIHNNKVLTSKWGESK